jgi:hypothetical protein
MLVSIDLVAHHFRTPAGASHQIYVSHQFIWSLISNMLQERSLNQ